MGMVELPSGTVTFLFTDLEVSTRLWDQEPHAMPTALARHDVILRDAIATHGGHVVKGTGDGVHAAFATADTAVRAAVSGQLAVIAERWPLSEPLRVRMGIHTGPAEQRDGDYYGTAVNRAARLMHVAHGGQIVVSLATEQLARDALDDGVNLADLGEHRLRDLARPERVFQVTRPDLPSEFPALRSVDAFPTNLPFQFTEFVGRDADLAAVSKALEDSRVVTLIGVGGVGKTRLAVQTAAELLPRYGDGVFLCELGPLTDPGQVPAVVANACGVQQRPGESFTESLQSTLRSKEMLVVLDNCEHLLDAAAELVTTLMASCPNVTVLATGREGLGVWGERMMMVRSLPMPGEAATTGEILAAEAVRLFTERAEQAGGGLVLDDDTAATVAQLCRRLDGVPLAIELAAARTRMMSPQEIAARLDERFRLLTGGSRTAVERHQTLQQAVDWSYGLLDERERTILDRFGVFAGGFTLDAAEAVVGDDDLDALDVLDGITQLVDKSLVVAEREHHDTRYRLLETIRTYALERLDDHGATDSMRRRHATWCAAFVAQACIGMQGPDEATWAARLEREIDNVRAALTWATGADDADLSLSLMAGFRFWMLFARSIEYVLGPWAAAALATTGASDDTRYAQVLAVRALDHFNHQRYDDAERDARDAVDLLAKSDVPFSPDPWLVLAGDLVQMGRAEEVVDGIDPLLEAARATGDDYTLGSALLEVALWRYVLADADRFLPAAEEAMVVAQRTGNPTLLSLAFGCLGLALEATDPAGAQSCLESAIDYGAAVGFNFWVGVSRGWLARMGADATNPQWATQFRSGLDLFDEAGDTRIVVSFLDVYSQSLATSDRAESAAILSAAVVELAPHLSNPISVVHRRQTTERLLAQLGKERFAELTAQGSTLSYDGAVALALAEIDRVIANDEGV
jgi:predicted ATPase/class 3 adenylate cyclase